MGPGAFCAISTQPEPDPPLGSKCQPPPPFACLQHPAKMKKKCLLFFGEEIFGEKKTQMIKNFIKAFKLFLERMQLHILTHKIICFIALGKASSQKKGGLVFSFEKKQMRV